MIKKNIISVTLLISIVFSLTSACQNGKESETLQKRADEKKVTKQEEKVATKEKKVAKHEEQRKREKQITYLADLIETKQYRVSKEYEKEIDKNRGLLMNDIDSHGKFKSIFHHPLQTGDNNITFPDIKIGPNTKFKFSYGIFTEKRDGFSTDGVKFIVMLDVDNKKEIIFAEILTEVDSWKNIALDLSGYSGRKGSIELITQPLTTWHYDWATWGSPRIISYSVDKDYELKNAELAEKYESIVVKYEDMAVRAGASRVDRGWLADSRITDINLTGVSEEGTIRTEVYVLDKAENDNEVLRVEIFDEKDKLLSVSRYEIKETNQMIRNEYDCDSNKFLPSKIRISIEGDVPSLFFIKEPILYSRLEKKNMEDKSNVILISLDTLRADHLGCYGYKRDVSPNIDALASESFIFTNAYSNSNWTLPAHTSLFTSLYPVQHQIVLKTWSNGLFKEYEGPFFYVTEAFKDANFITIGFTGGAYVHSRYGFNRGFDYHIEDIKQLDDQSLDSLIKLIEIGKDVPMFLFFHTYEIHDYYLEKSFYRLYVTDDFRRDEARLADHIALQAKDIWSNPRFEIMRNKLMPAEGIRYVIDLYDGAIFYTDKMLGRFFEKLKDMGIYDETWVIITSDHGEGFGDIHNDKHTRSWSHGSGLYDNLTRIPLIIKPPKSLKSDLSDDRTMDEFVQTVDIAPTLLSIIGVSEREDFSGRSLLPLLLKGKRLDDMAIFSEELNTQQFSVVLEGYKLIKKPRSHLFADRNKFYFELYNLKDDQYETVNLLHSENSSKYFPIQNELKRVLGEHVKTLFSDENLSGEFVREREQKSEDADVKQIKRLKELGYL